MTPYQYIEAKTILSKLRQADPYFGIMYNMNLYRGCQHGCVYCDTRSECYGVGDISQIRIKRNALVLLRKELQSKIKNKGTIGTGSMNDPYMPIEREIGHTRNALKIIAENKYPVHVITKSDLVTRDIDILKDISKTYAAVSLTITTFDEKIASKLEPNAPSTRKRFDALYQLSKNGIYTGITLMPVLPFINDTELNLRQILNMAKDCGASYVIPMFGTTLRKGSREYFYNALDEHFPIIKQSYKKQFGEKYECMSPNLSLLNSTFKMSGLPRKMKFYNPNTPEQLTLF